MTSPTTTAATASTIIRMQIFFLELRWEGGQRHKRGYVSSSGEFNVSDIKPIYWQWRTANAELHHFFLILDMKGHNGYSSLNEDSFLTWYSDARASCCVPLCTCASAFSTLASMLSAAHTGHTHCHQPAQVCVSQGDCSVCPRLSTLTSIVGGEMKAGPTASERNHELWPLERGPSHLSCLPARAPSSPGLWRCR